MPKQERSELECFIIGLLWQLGPSSAYDLRVHMRNSPSTQWSASAGAIYPLLERLEVQGLLISENTHTGKRRRSVYTPTDAGLRALRTWIGPPLAPDAATVAHDPLRSRARFLGVLTPSTRRKWLVAARAALDEVEQQINAWERAVAPKDTFAAHMTRCGHLDLEARRRWIAELDERLDQPRPSQPRPPSTTVLQTAKRASARTGEQPIKAKPAGGGSAKGPATKGPATKGQATKGQPTKGPAAKRTSKRGLSQRTRSGSGKSR